MDTRARLKKVFEQLPEVKLCILFGSMAKQKETPESDLDIAIAESRAIDAKRKQQLIEVLAETFRRPIDLIDLQSTSGTLLHQILTKGELIFCHNHTLYDMLKSLRKCFLIRLI